MPEITPAILAAADQVDTDLDALDMSTRTLLSLLRAGDVQPPGGGGGETVVPRVGGGTAGAIAYKVATDFVPASAVSLAGFNDANQDNISLVACVWQVTDGTALISAAPAVTQVDGVHEARFSSPVSLEAGKRYRFGWVANVSGNAKAVTSASTWAGFTIPSTALYYANDRGTGRPATSFFNYWVPFDLVLA